MILPILKPAVLLVIWSIVMFVWAAAARSKDPAAHALGINGMKRTAAVAGQMSPASQYKIDNYNHLMEQPTVYYAIVLVLAVSNAASPLTITLSWVYVGSRVVHSIVQATSNDVRLRLPLFLVGTVSVLALGVNAAMLAFGGPA